METNFTARLSTNQNVANAPRKINPDHLDDIVDVPLADGRWAEMTGRNAINAFNRVAEGAQQENA